MNQRFNNYSLKEINEELISLYFYKLIESHDYLYSTLKSIRYALKSVLDYVQEKYVTSTITDILLSYASIRTGEMCALRKKDIDLDNGFISIHESVERVKQDNGKSELTLLEPRSKTSFRDVPISRFVNGFFVDYFECYSMKLDDYILSQGPKIYEPHLLQRNLRELCSILHIKTSFSILRDTFISTCLHKNMNIRCLCEIIGNINFSRIYELCPESSKQQKRSEIERITNESMNKAT